jgi:hypothetical protein
MAMEIGSKVKLADKTVIIKRLMVDEDNALIIGYEENGVMLYNYASDVVE